MDIRITQTPLPGCFLIRLPEQKDIRGRFVKLFNEDTFRDNGLETAFPEVFFSVSRKGVLRGLHFQTPPWDHVKLVCCLDGHILDAVVDLRCGSPMYGRFATFELSANEAAMLYIPSGMAHGYYVRSETAMVFYQVSKPYAPDHDKGILWCSAGIPWPSAVPVLSARDELLPALEQFDNPFKFTDQFMDQGG
ncbi:MAG: dTDP-4-dehydrorhamnose 3,5-epimerase [Syntrophus sp. SKADARSKE-3]|nr:dTDP-4-dehydrorhamnose 3,5-epimerase [Syntrophus sp. SKADARSKE-3]